MEFLTGTPGLETAKVPGSLGYQHPWYQRLSWWRHFWNASYKGGVDYLKPSISIEFQYPIGGPKRDASGAPLPGTAAAPIIDKLPIQSFLFRFDREEATEYENRRKRASYTNYVRPIVNALVSHTMKTAPLRDGPAELKAFWEGCDRTRTVSMDLWMRNAARRANVLGLWYAVADVGAEESDGKPYIYGVSPLDVLDWQTDEYGRFVWLKQYIASDEARTWNQGWAERPLFRLWTRETVVTYDRAQKVITPERAHGFGRVPFEPVYSLCGKDEDVDWPEATPFAADLAKMNNRVFNLDSLADQLAYDQTFSQLIVPDESGSLDEVQMGTKRAWGYNPGPNGGEPKYIAPDPEQARVLLEQRADVIEQMRQAAGVGRGRSEASMQKSSGEALQLESEDKRSILGDLAEEQESAERRIAALVMSYRTRGAPAEPPVIQYSRQFDLRSFQQQVNEVLGFQKVGLPEPVNKAVKRTLVGQYFRAQNATQAEVDKMMAAIDAMPDEPDAPDEPADGGDQRPRPPGA